jgi:hypothetical protein
MKDEPAFPILEHGIGGESFVLTPGLTKRELFAAMAMQGLARGAVIENEDSIKNHARRSVRYADALLSELQKESKV